jgi:chromosome segregation ATPase
VKAFQTIVSGSLLTAMVFCGAHAEAQETHTQRAQKNDALKQVNNVKAETKDLEQLQVPPQITGFHPIKKIVQPITNLEKTSEQLDKEATKLEQPLSTFRKPILDVQHGMTHVDSRVTAMQGEITGTEKQVEGVRSDIADMRKDIQSLKEPVVALQEPMEKVAGPLEAVQKQLKVVLLAIFIGSMATAFGIPLTFVVLWKYRAKFFPGLSHEHISHHLQNTYPTKV